MKPITRQEFTDLMATSAIKPRLRRELRFVPEEIADWEGRDFIVATTKSGNEGVMIARGTQKAIPFQLQARKPNQNGRVEAIICDICSTWQRGTHSALITFPRSDGSSLSLLCCADLDCSLHVRGKTKAATLSKTQLREDISPEGRILRLQDRLADILERL